MAEWCIENEDRIDVSATQSKYSRTVNLEDYVNPPKSEKAALLILNQAIGTPNLFLKLWNKYPLRVCADGGANRLYELFEKNEDARSKYLPDYIIGDFDSLKPHVGEYYQKSGVPLIKQETQYSTDFSKCLCLIALHIYSGSFRDKIVNQQTIEAYSGIHDLYDAMLKDSNIIIPKSIRLLAIGAIDGRFDQTIHSITQLYQLSVKESLFNLCYLSATDLIFLISPGGVLIEYSKKFRDECIGCCGLLPLGGPTEIYETRGLKWDVGNWYTSIASGKVSSSNRFSGIDKCFVDCKEGIVMNIEVFTDKLYNYI